MKKLIILSFACMLLLSASAQTIEGDAIMDMVGTKADAAKTQNFLAAYDIKNPSGAKFFSNKTGIDMTADHDTLVSMTLYHDSPIYGKYTHKLPKGLTFSMSSDDVTKTVADPQATRYTNSGYVEYRFGKYVLTCWFEEKTLNRVTISLK